MIYAGIATSVVAEPVAIVSPPRDDRDMLNMVHLPCESYRPFTRGGTDMGYGAMTGVVVEIILPPSMATKKGNCEVVWFERLE